MTAHEPVFSDRNQAAVDRVVHPPTPATPRTWTVRIPAVLDGQRRADWLNSNDRRNRYAQAHLVKLWREQARFACLAARLPRDVTRVRLAFAIHYASTSRRRDAHNLGPTIKAVIDGLVDARFLPDDNDQHVVETSTRAGDPAARPAITMTITEEPS